MNAQNTDKSGSVLMVVLSVMVVLTIAMTSIMKTALQQSYSARLRYDSELAFYGAQSGIEAAATYIADNIAYMPRSYAGSGVVSSVSYNYTITNTAYKTYEIYAEGVLDNSKRAIVMTQVSSATYAQFSLWSRENGSIYFTAEEEFGSVHADDRLYFSTAGTNGPTFWGKVTSLADSYYCSGNIDYVNFNEGFELSTENGSMAELDFEALETLATSYGLHLSGQTTIAFEDDVMIITNEEAGWDAHRVTLGDEQLVYIEDSEVITTTSVTNTYTYYVRGRPRTYSYVTTEVDVTGSPGELTLEGGSLDGRVTIVAEDEIYITNDMVYTVPATPYDDSDAESDDALGLISGSDVVISTDRYTQDDINIHASIIASGTLDSDGSFYVENYNSGDWRGYINLVGGIAQDIRGAVGTFSTYTGYGSTGYSKNYVYDDRFSTTPPPYYPAVSYDLVYDRWTECAPRE
jgi:hypothetical protein